jgi:hypothetical protein
MGPVHKDSGAVRLGSDRKKDAGPGNSRKNKGRKKDEQDDKTVDAGQIYPRPDAEYGFKAYLSESFRPRRDGLLVFPVCVPHTGIIEKPPYLVNKRDSW